LSCGTDAGGGHAADHDPAAGGGAVRLQDGSFDDWVLAYATTRFPVLVHHACIMVVTAGL
jgi:hypothetical protein